MGEIAGPAVRLVLLVALLFGIGGPDRLRIGVVRRPWILGFVAVAGLVAYVGFARVHENVNRVHIHHWDVYHYYVGAKYYAELGQEGLYEATVVADFEDERSGFRPRATVRDLRDTAREITRREVLARRAEIQGRFSAARWRDFKSDIAFFRAADPELWRSSQIQRDHGYNGSPLTTAILGGLANLHPGSTADFLALIVWADLALIVLTAAWIGSRLGATAGAFFLVFWLLNPLNDYAITGGSFLRYNYFIVLALAVALHREGRRVATGICLAFAAAFRIFPLAFLLGLLACDLLAADRRDRLRRHARLYGAAAAMLAILVASTSFVPTPSGDNPWVEQLRTVGKRNALHAPNGISLRFPFLYSGEHNVDAAIESARTGGSLDWLAETQQTFERRIGGYLAALALLGGLALRSASRSRDAEGFFPGLVAIYGILILSHYYYCLLTLIPLMFREDPRVTVGVTLSFALLTVTAWVPAVLDLQYAVFSVEVGLGLTAILVWQGFAARSEPGSASA